MDVVTKKARSLILDRATLALAAVAGLCLVGTVVLVCVAVLLRYFANAPILGVNEIVQLGGVAMVMMAMPWCTERNAHVRADVFDPFIGHWGRLGGDVMSRAISIFVLSVLVMRSWDKMLDAREFGDATNMLALPIWPFYGLMALGLALTVAIFAIQIVLVLVSGKEFE
ncbi:TRAP transporter small permease [Jiella sonneratiae]|uniref:TRAP transporter small permease protein n=1 Tax=Jiella sonneratiae TaxID=2816856 RepID=A0ABS3J8P2_9HYPH|nr:TRAP transporter small permease [Jiella sonneratiae]MBO0906045.1 TRAP transporter small permease [Jiella sonneratiae]